MRRLQTGPVAALAVGASVAAVVAAGPVAAADPPTPAPTASLSIRGDLKVTPTIHLLRIDAKGSKGADGKTTGTYRATLLDGANPTPIQVRGPVTCIDVSPTTASLVYPISEIRPFGTLPGGLKDAFAIQITARKTAATPANGAKKNAAETTAADKNKPVDGQVGVRGPMATSAFKGCAPAATPFAFHGVIDTSTAH